MDSRGTGMLGSLAAARAKAIKPTGMPIKAGKPNRNIAYRDIQQKV
jgi:hypothetical protein